MKKEINNENKAKFFALYYDQNVMFQIGKVKSYDLYITQKGIDVLVYGESGYLTLKPLSKISDEDAIQIAKLIFKNDSFHTIDRGKRYINQMIISGNEYSQNYFSFYKVTQILDFLRSKGYALPYMGLSIDEMVEAGWVKLLGT